MALVYNNIDKVAGQAHVGIVVNISLLWDTSESPVPKIVDEDTVVQGDYGTQTDDDGRWETDLVPNDEILPAGSVYKITERNDSSTSTYYIQVPNSATPTSWIGDILVDEPDWV